MDRDVALPSVSGSSSSMSFLFLYLMISHFRFKVARCPECHICHWDVACPVPCTSPFPCVNKPFSDEAWSCRTCIARHVPASVGWELGVTPHCHRCHMVHYREISTCPGICTSPNSCVFKPYSEQGWPCDGCEIYADLFEGVSFPSLSLLIRTNSFLRVPLLPDVLYEH